MIAFAYLMAGLSLTLGITSLCGYVLSKYEVSTDEVGIQVEKKPSAPMHKVIPHPDTSEMWVIEGTEYQSLSQTFLKHLALRLDEVDPLPLPKSDPQRMDVIRPVKKPPALEARAPVTTEWSEIERAIRKTDPERTRALLKDACQPKPLKQVHKDSFLGTCKYCKMPKTQDHYTEKLMGDDYMIAVVCHSRFGFHKTLVSGEKEV